MKGFTHESRRSVTVDWWTPPEIFELLGMKFDLDPCAPVGGVPWIPAANHYSENGLDRPWFGTVWLNPPYGKHTGLWLKKMHEYRNGIALVFSRTDCKWFHDYAVAADAIFFLKGRVAFVDGFGATNGTGVGCGSMLIGWGNKSVDAIRNLMKRRQGLFVDLRK